MAGEKGKEKEKGRQLREMEDEKRRFHLDAIHEEHETALNLLKSHVSPHFHFASFLNEHRALKPKKFTHFFNGFTVEITNKTETNKEGDSNGSISSEELRKLLTEQSKRDALKVNIKKLPNIKNVFEERIFHLHLYGAVPLINATQLWASNKRIKGIPEKAGAGIKIASIDGGLHRDAPMFSGKGFSYPRDYPVGGYGDTSNNNGKIIASRAYFRPDDLPIEGDKYTYPSVRGNAHGHHTAGIAAGNRVTVNYTGLLVNISGVAPGAWLMSYKVFYSSERGFRGASESELMAALEDAGKDGADVINNSWGNIDMGTVADPISTIFRNLIDSGIVVVQSAGNDGPFPYTMGSNDGPITVGATTSTPTFRSNNVASIFSNKTIPSVAGSLKEFPFTEAKFGISLRRNSITGYRWISLQEHEKNNKEGCKKYSSATTRLIAKDPKRWGVLVPRGGCYFKKKAVNARKAGFSLLIISSDSNALFQPDGDPKIKVGNITSVMIPRDAGDQMSSLYQQLLSKNKGDISSFAPEIRFNTTVFFNQTTPFELVDFSSRGPSLKTGQPQISPDIVAPGVDILSQGFGADPGSQEYLFGFGISSGTSMAAPMVSGAAALLRQVHPNWTPSIIKSAIMASSRYSDVSFESQRPYQSTAARVMAMGSGHLDVLAASRIQLVITPPSLSFGNVPEGETKRMNVTIRSLKKSAFLSVRLEDRGTNRAQGFSLDTSTLSIPVRGTTSLTLSFTASFSTDTKIDDESIHPGEREVLVILEDALGGVLHFPAAATVVCSSNQVKDFLVLSNDASQLPSPDTKPSVKQYYSDALSTLGYTFDEQNLDRENSGDSQTYLSRTGFKITGQCYRGIIHITGKNNFDIRAVGWTDWELAQVFGYSLGASPYPGPIIIAMGKLLPYVLGAASDELVPPLTSVSFGMTPQPYYFYELAQLENVSAFSTAPQEFIGLQLKLKSNIYLSMPDPEDFERVSSSAPSTRIKAPRALFGYEGGYKRHILGQSNFFKPSFSLSVLLYRVHSACFTFGLEDLEETPNDQAKFLGLIIRQLFNRPTAFLRSFLQPDLSTLFVVDYQSNVNASAVNYLWDVGGESPLNTTQPSLVTSGNKVVQVLVLDSLGATVIASPAN